MHSPPGEQMSDLNKIDHEYQVAPSQQRSAKPLPVGVLEGCWTPVSAAVQENILQQPATKLLCVSGMVPSRGGRRCQGPALAQLAPLHALQGPLPSPSGPEDLCSLLPLLSACSLPCCG